MSAVGGTRVTSCKQTAKLMKQAPEKFSVRIERLTAIKPQEQDVRFEEDNVSLKVEQSADVGAPPEGLGLKMRTNRICLSTAVTFA